MNDRTAPLLALAAEIFGDNPMAAVSTDKETLLTRVESLLNARISFERALARGPIQPAENEDGWTRRMDLRAYEVFLAADKLFPELIGELAFKTFFPNGSDEQSDSGKRHEFVRRLSTFRRLLSQPDWEATLSALRTEIRDMDGGDQPEILIPERRSPGQSRQPTRVARLRLRALCWNEYLKRQGIDTVTRKAEIASAYKTDWEPIRKWRKSCEAAFGALAVARELRDAQFDWYWYVEIENKDDWRRVLAADGARYYEVWRNQRG